MSITSFIVRRTFKRSDDKRDAGLTTPDDIMRYDNVVYGPDPAWNRLDVYRPKAAGDRLLPAIISIHGGGWVYGDKERYQYYCMSLAQQGFAVVNFSYHLAPKAKFPSIVKETADVFAWTVDHGEDYGIDMSHIFAVGDSAGAHTLAQYSAIATNPKYAVEFPFFVTPRMRPTAVALNCGIYHYGSGDASKMNDSLMKDYLPRKTRKRAYKLMSCQNYVTENFPPVFLMTATGDFLLGEAAPMDQKLTECGVEHEYRIYGTEENKLGHVFHCNMKLPEAAECNKDECDFFKRYL